MTKPKRKIIKTNKITEARSAEAKDTNKSITGFFTPKKIAIIILVVIVLGFIFWIWGTYNAFISKDQNVGKQWANVETQYQRRIDLIPNLVNSVKGYMTYEQALLTNITQLRSQWITSATIDDKIQYQTQLDTAISRLLMIKENYPDLKADKTVTQLMDELAGTENRIAVERSRYNEVVRDFNVLTKQFPSNVIARWFGFKEKTYYQATTPGAENVPVVNLQ